MKSALWSKLNIFKRDNDELDTKITILERTPLFRDISRSKLKLLLNIMHEREYRENELIFKEGDNGKGLYIIVSGKVRIFKSNYAIITLENGDFFGEFSLLDKQPRSATAQAMVNTKILGFFYPDLQDIININHKLGIQILLNLGYVLSLRLRQANDELEKFYEVNQDK